MPLTGDFGKLDALAGQMKKFATEFSGDVRRDLADEVRRQLGRVFASRTSPDGAAWAPSPKGLAGILGALDVSLSSAGIEIRGGGSKFAGEHNRGYQVRPHKGPHLTFQSRGQWWRPRKTLVRRRAMVPRSGQLGRWGEPMRAIVEAIFARLAG